MKYQFERNLKIVTELMTYLHKLGSKDINVKLKSDTSNTTFIIWGKINNITSEELDNLNTILNTDRQHEIEEYYWYLDGNGESDDELPLIGMMIDKAEINYLNNILTLKIYRNEI